MQDRDLVFCQVEFGDISNKKVTLITLSSILDKIINIKAANGTIKLCIN